MKGASRLGSRRTVLSFVAALVGLSFVAPAGAQLTIPGNDAVYNSSGNTALSPAFIDASIFLPPLGSQATDICDAIYQILRGNHNFLKNGYPSSGAVIDARGVEGTTNLTCTQGSPWTEGNNTVSAPSTILLPPTPAATPIVIPSTWTLPPNTHLIGEGEGILSTGFTLGTTIQAQSGFAGAMISLGLSSGCTPCTGISVQNLTLDGQRQSIDGIDNANAQDLSFVDHAALYRIRGTGLAVSGTANNSGPYSNITFDLGGDSGTSSTHCASINGSNGLTGTHGIHGLSCMSENNDPPAAVLLDASNNSIEDVKIVGFYDGILVGCQRARAKQCVGQYYR